MRVSSCSVGYTNTTSCLHACHQKHNTVSFKALSGLLCADVLLRNYSLTHSVRHRLLVSWHLQKISQDLLVFTVILEHRTAHY